MTQPDHWKRIENAVRTIGERLASKTAIGDRAALRRLNYALPDAPAFWKIVVSDLDGVIADHEPERGRDERRWAALLAGFAEVAGAGLHRRGRPLGEAAAAAKLLEARFTRLLRAHDDALLDLIQPLAHQLVAKGESVDWLDVVRLILSDGTPNEDDVRRHLAQRYYATLHKSSTKKEPTA
jgi:CRISPR type I-E-associated protein CasB/Cse2